MRQLLLLGLFISGAHSVPANQAQCESAFKYYFQEADLIPAIQDQCIGASCQYIYASILANADGLRSQANAQFTQDSSLVVQRAAGTCGRDTTLNSDYCSRLEEQGIATAETKRRTSVTAANQYQRDLMRVYLDMAAQYQCADHSATPPDLVVDSVQAFFSDNKDSLYFSYIIANIGETASAGFSVEVSTQDGKIGDVTFEPIGSLKYLSDYRAIKITSKATTITIFADVYNAVQESDESNNSAAVTFTTPLPVALMHSQRPQAVQRPFHFSYNILGRRFGVTHLTP